MTTDQFRFLTVIEVDYTPANPHLVVGRWSHSVEGWEASVHGSVKKADDGEPELPGFIVNAIESTLETEAGHAWMQNQMREVVR